MARTYKRDARGRFASGGGSSRPRVTGGTLQARTSARRSKAKLAAKDPADQSLSGSLSRRAQKGAVTRTSKALKAAQQGSRVRLSGRSGVVRPGRGGVKKAAPVVAKAKARPASGRKKGKTEAEVLWQADRIMGKLAKRAAVAVNRVNVTGLQEGLRQARRTNARAGRVTRSLESRGLYGKYMRLTAPADPIRMTPAGPGIKPPRRRRR